MSSNELCKACTLLEGLERGMASSGIVSPCYIVVFMNRMLIVCDLQTERARKRLEAGGPTPDNLRTIPFFKPPSGNPTVAIEVPS